MNVRDSDILLAALDRRLQVDRIATIDPLAPAARSTDAPRQPPSAPLASPVNETSEPDLVDHLPLGRVVAARVVEVPQADRVVADVGDLRIEMTWPSGSLPRPGDDIALRVLANRPGLLFETVHNADVDADALDASADDGVQLRWSANALRLQAGHPGASGGAASPTRFDVPMLQTDVAPLLSSVPVAPSARHDAVAVDAAPARSNDGVPPAFVPLVLQGPAWLGQPMELVVRRERRDDQLDDPVLDQWCGEVTIELPNLGRVAGHLAFSMQGLRLRLEGDDEAAVAAMTAGGAELAETLTNVELRVAALSVGRPATDIARVDG